MIGPPVHGCGWSGRKPTKVAAWTASWQAGLRRGRKDKVRDKNTVDKPQCAYGVRVEYCGDCTLPQPKIAPNSRHQKPSVIHQSHYYYYYSPPRSEFPSPQNPSHYNFACSFPKSPHSSCSMKYTRILLLGSDRPLRLRQRGFPTATIPSASCYAFATIVMKQRPR